MNTTARPCGCGSGQPSQWAHDARGIELARVCPRCEAAVLARFRPEVLYRYKTFPRCEAAVLARFRPEVLHDGAYETDEDLDPDGEW